MNEAGCEPPVRLSCPPEGAHANDSGESAGAVCEPAAGYGGAMPSAFAPAVAWNEAWNADIRPPRIVMSLSR